MNVAYGKTIQVITGGAGGMGLAICKRIANRGPLFVVNSTQEKLDRAKILLIREGIEEVTYVKCDISDLEQVKVLADQVRYAGDVGSVIHTAANSPVQADAKRILEVNAIGTVNIMDIFYSLMFPGSTMTTITSIAGYMWPVSEETLKIFDEPHSPDFLEKLHNLSCKESNLAYPISKAFCMHYTKQNTLRWAKKGARINTVSAGCFTTPMGLADMIGGEMITGETALGRWGNPDEIATVVEFISSEAASYITGTDIVVDGGYRANSGYKQYDQVME